MNSVKYLFYMELLNYLFCDMFGGILECYELWRLVTKHCVALPLVAACGMSQYRTY